MKKIIKSGPDWFEKNQKCRENKNYVAKAQSDSRRNKNNL